MFNVISNPLFEYYLLYLEYEYKINRDGIRVYLDLINPILCEIVSMNL